MDARDTLRQVLIGLSAELAGFEQMAILGEGNVSARVTEDRFLVKASGTSLSELAPDQLVELDASPLRDAVDGEAALSDDATERLLLDARVDEDALRPSVESLFHAWLLGLEGVGFVGHTHPVAVNALLCSPHAERFARERLFPDQVVYCGAESVLVPYVDPGLVLARTIARQVDAFRARTGAVPKTILLENHGLIGLGRTAADVRAALHMAEKSARIYAAAAALGGPVAMSPHHVARIDRRLDEHYRQRMLRDQ